MARRRQNNNEKRVRDNISVVTMCDQCMGRQYAEKIEFHLVVTTCLAILEENVVLSIKHTMKWSDGVSFIASSVAQTVQRLEQHFI